MTGPTPEQLLFNRFQEAVRDGPKEDVVDVIRTPSFPIDFRSPTGRRPLHLLCEKGQHETVALVLDMGAEIKAVDNRGKTALHYAAKSGNNAVVQLLLERGLTTAGLPGEILPEDAPFQEVHKQDASRVLGKETPLHWAVFACKMDTARFILSKATDPQSLVDAFDNDGDTVLHWACNHGRIGLIRELVSTLGADPGKGTALGVTPLHLAAESGEMEMVRLLVEELGVAVDAQDSQGDTPLHSAVQMEMRDVVDYLISRPGCSWEKRNAAGKTAEDVAVDLRVGDGIQALLEGAREGSLAEVRERLVEDGREAEKIRKAVAMAKRVSAHVPPPS